MSDVAYTGGLLNELNEKMKISSARNSVPIMKLIKLHHPQSYGELEQLVEYHYLEKCKCGVRSKGTVRDFGENLYEAQLEYWGEYRYSRDECIRWEYDLFIVQSLKGEVMEDEAVFYLRGCLPLECDIDRVNGYVDTVFRVDVIVKYFGEVVCGVQVKPLSYEYCTEDVKVVNDKGNAKFGFDVLYLFYEDGVFTNLCDVVRDVLGIIFI